MGMGAFGVEIPDNLNDESAPDNTSANPEVTESAPVVDPEVKETESQEPQITDLASLERFRFGDKELTRDELKSLIEGQSEQRPVSEEKAKFEENFPYDLAAVVKDPKRFAEFSQLYPREFVQRAESVLKRYGIETAQREPAPGAQNLEEVTKQFPWLKSILGDLDSLKGTIKSYEEQKKSLELEQTSAWLDKNFDKFSKKYPDADNRLVNLALSEAAKKGSKITEMIIEKAFKKDHDERNARWEAKYKSKVEEQKTANFKARDMGAGGQVPSAAAQQPRTMKEARQSLMNAIEASH